MVFKKIFTVLLVSTLLLSFGVTAQASGLDQSVKSAKAEGKENSEKKHSEKKTHSSRPAQSQSETPAISEAEAWTIVLDRADLDEAQTSHKTCDLHDSVYEIEFTANQNHYKYAVSAATGDILKQESPDLKETENNSAVSSLQAENTALKAAGIERSAVKYIHSYLEYSGGKPYAFHVEFGVYNRENNQSLQYSYLIDLDTGEILQ